MEKLVRITGSQELSIEIHRDVVTARDIRQTLVQQLHNENWNVPQLSTLEGNYVMVRAHGLIMHKFQNK